MSITHQLHAMKRICGKRRLSFPCYEFDAFNRMMKKHQENEPLGLPILVRGPYEEQCKALHKPAYPHNNRAKSASAV